MAEGNSNGDLGRRIKTITFLNTMAMGNVGNDGQKEATLLFLNAMAMGNAEAGEVPVEYNEFLNAMAKGNKGPRASANRPAHVLKRYGDGKPVTYGGVLVLVTLFLNAMAMGNGARWTRYVTGRGRS